MPDRSLHRARLLGALPKFLESRGVAPTKVLNRAGLSEEQVTDLLGTMVRAQFNTAADQAARVLGDHAFGLDYAMAMGPGHLSASARALSLAPTLECGLRVAKRLVPLFHSGTSIEVTIAGSSVTYSFRLLGSDPQSVAFFIEIALAVAVRMIRNSVGPDWVPHHVEFAHKGPPKATCHEDFFGSPVQFGASRSAITFDAAVLRVRKGHLDEGGLRALETEQRLPDGEQRWHDDFRLVEGIERVIDGLLALGNANVIDVARTLGLAPRTLQYRLSGLGMSFRELVDNRRNRAARNFLSNRDTSVTEVAFLLGYVDAAHFSRAFHRWNGMSPSTFRYNDECSAHRNLSDLH